MPKVFRNILKGGPRQPPSTVGAPSAAHHEARGNERIDDCRLSTVADRLERDPPSIDMLRALNRTPSPIPPPWERTLFGVTAQPNPALLTATNQDDQPEEEDDKDFEDEDEENLAQESQPSGSDDVELLQYIERELSDHKESVVQFASRWGTVVLEALVKDAAYENSKMYKWKDPNTQEIEKAWDWRGAIVDLWFETREVVLNEESYPVQLILLPFSTKLRLNNHFKYTLQALEDGLKLHELRLLLCMGGDATGRQSSGNYTIFTRPTIDIQAKIDRFVASGGVDFGLLNMKAKLATMYHGTAAMLKERTGFTGRAHRSEGKPVNKRLARERTIAKSGSYGVTSHADWLAFVDCTTYDEEAGVHLSFPVRHVLEHFSIVVFRLTSLSEGGLNVNVMDSMAFKTLVPAVEAIRVLEAMNAVHKKFPKLLPPAAFDLDAWAILLAPLFPEGTPATIRTVFGIATLRTRRHLHNKAELSEEFLTFDPWDRSTDRFIRAGSASHPTVIKSVVPPMRPAHLAPVKVLEAMAGCVADYARDHGLRPLDRPDLE